MNFLKKALLIFVIFYVGYVMFATVYYFSTGQSKAQSYYTPTPAPFSPPPWPISPPPPYEFCAAGVGNINYRDRCGKKADNTYKRANFRCLDNSRGELRSRNCLADSAFYKAAYSSCQTLAKCPPSTPTPTPSYNNPPEIDTYYLPTASVNQNYYAEIAAHDLDADPLIMTIEGLPKGLNQGPCRLNEYPENIPISLYPTGSPPFRGGFISCVISGVPSQPGLYKVKATVTDSISYPVNRFYTLNIDSFPPPCLTLTPPPCPGGYLEKIEPSYSNNLVCPIYQCVIPLTTSPTLAPTITY